MFRCSLVLLCLHEGLPVCLQALPSLQVPAFTVTFSLLSKSCLFFEFETTRRINNHSHAQLDSSPSDAPFAD